MKKLLLSCLFAFLFSGMQIANAQLASGTYAPDFTATDINGNSWHLYDILAQGKTVYLDISATWCSPCWSYHTSGKLEGLYNQYGPPGTNEVMVFFIEGESQNTTAQLYGPAGGSTYADATQGDWVTGTPYPIIDNSTIANNYQISYFPTIYMICPDRWVTEIGTLTTAQLYAGRNNCSFQTANLDAGIFDPSVINNNLSTCDNVDLSFRIANYGTTPLTSATVDFLLGGNVVDTYNWTGNLGTYESDQVNNAATITGSGGNNNVTIRVSNPNAGTDQVTSNDSKQVSFYVYSSPGFNAFSEDFESGNAIPAGWHSTHTGSDDWVSAGVGYNSATSDMLSFYSIGDGSVFTLIPTETNLSQYNGSSVALEFDVAHAMYGGNGGTNYIDRLKVMVQECGGNWTTLYNKSGKADPSAANSLSTVAPVTNAFEPSSANEWRHESISLNNYLSSQSLIIKFEATSGYGNNLYIDNININTAVGISEEAAAVGLSIYPNPFSNSTNVYYNVEGMQDVNVRVYNITGQEVYTNDFGLQTAGQHNFQISADHLAAGIYVMNLTIGNKTVSHKLSVTK